MELVYRLEHKETGRGVSHGGAMSVLNDWQNNKAYDHPGPHCQREATENGDYPLYEAVRSSDDFRFGFLNATQGRSWFGRAALCKLAGAGIVLRVYLREDIKELVEGNFQCVFKRPERAFTFLPTALWTPVLELKTSIRRTIEGRAQ
ncbi:MAG: hypothetical protein AAGF48_14920 [Pseudomonadota bacterium]